MWWCGSLLEKLSRGVQLAPGWMWGVPLGQPEIPLQLEEITNPTHFGEMKCL